VIVENISRESGGFTYFNPAEYEKVCHLSVCLSVRLCIRIYIYIYIYTYGHASNWLLSAWTNFVRIRYLILYSS
jgi:hypothetical protein